MHPRLLLSRGDDLPTRKAAVYGVGIGFMAFISIVIALRLWVRIFMLRAMGTDDVLMVVGTLLTFGLTITTMIGTQYGIGKHLSDINLEDYEALFKSVWATRILYTVGMGFVKMSLLWFFLRLDQRWWMRWSVFFVMFIVVGLSFASFVGSIVSCTPPSKFWDVTGERPGHCMSPGPQQDFYEVNGILNIVTDILIWLLPIPMLWQLHITLVAAIFGVFSIGILALSAACVRYNFVLDLEGNKDQFYPLADSLNWCTIEVYVAIFCGSAPSLSVLIKTYAPRVFGTSKAQNYASGTPTPGHNLANKLPKTSRHRRLEETTGLGSQDAIVLNEREPDGITLKTDIHMEVTDGNGAYVRETYSDFTRRA
ncbi:hypothetical protein P170DRAFT_409820 [Aspergillus steynii IBT 23096]|uniref:Rhodopsin domain-containing protein n=1 Tax=Aspergillus steynii IBT 23096 TaxID=1392250 RepID=A0A2I2G426_9EURO|nr:uncharacterized protein P170DRAFT_409820 [Aspergillus steynii IBT 23096]PLB47613.1 hypothetical protein P170DRAFT_409820 [Aspergillus steynii IBT 23096]